MKVIRFARYGGPDVLELADVPDPVPAPRELLVQVRAIGVNPADGKWRAGMFQQIAPIPLPRVGGYDIAGEVIGGTGLPIGTRVAVMLDPMRAGAYAEQVATDANHVVVLPDTIDFATAAAVPTPGTTALQAIDSELRVQPGQRVAITGATGAVGRYAVRAAKDAGAVVIAAVRASARGAALDLGVNEIVVLDGASYAGARFDHLLDTVGGAVVAPLCQAVTSAGQVVTIATTPIPPAEIVAAMRFFAVRPNAAYLTRLFDGIASGAIAAPATETLPLAQAGEAQRRVEAGGRIAKTILVP